MGPKRTLVCNLHINLGHTNNKYGEVKWHCFITTFPRPWRPWVTRLFLHMSGLNPKLKIISDGMFVEAEEVLNEIS